jgi:hypothetical protein
MVLPSGYQKPGEEEHASGILPRVAGYVAHALSVCRMPMRGPQNGRQKNQCEEEEDTKRIWHISYLL